MQQTTKRPQKKYWIIAICICAIAITGYLSKHYLYMAYYYTSKYDHYNTDDKVYVAQSYFDDKKVGVLMGMQVIRPLTKEEIDTMSTNSYKHFNVKPVADRTSIPYACITGINFDIAKMKQQKSGCIGTFIKYSIVYVKDVSNKYNVSVILCAIKPNEKIFNNKIANVYIPDNFTLKDSVVYVDPFQISNKELSNF